MEARITGTPYRLILEPGRAVVGDAGTLVTRVLYVKRNQRKNFIVVDAGMSDLMRPSLYGSYHEIVSVQPQPCERLRADVVGPLCETGDFLAENREMPDVRSGDLLAILKHGKTRRVSALLAVFEPDQLAPLACKRLPEHVIGAWFDADGVLTLLVVLPLEHIGEFAAVDLDHEAQAPTAVEIRIDQRDRYPALRVRTMACSYTCSWKPCFGSG